MPHRRTTAAFALRALLWGVASGVIAFLALRTSPNLIELSWLPHEVSAWGDRHGVLRNVPAFAGLYVLSLPLFGLRRSWWACAVVCLLGAGLELAQLNLPQRTFDWDDIFASWAGALFVHLPVWSLCKLSRFVLGRARDGEALAGPVIARADKAG